jgi:hypothetical protein
MLRPMILLAVDAAIFHKIASTFFEFDVVQCSLAARGTHLLNSLLLYAAAH